MQDQTPITWEDGVTHLDDTNFNQEIRNAALLLLNPPTCSIRRTTSQSIPNGSGWTAVSFDTVMFDTEDPDTPMYSSGNPTRITVTTPGWYELVASSETNYPGVFSFTAAFRINGSTIYAGSTAVENPTTTNVLAVNPSNLLPFSANDYVELVMQHTYTSAVNIVVAGYTPMMMIARRRGL